MREGSERIVKYGKIISFSHLIPYCCKLVTAKISWVLIRELNKIRILAMMLQGRHSMRQFDTRV